MNFMPRLMRTHGELLRTRTRLDPTGLLFLTSGDPKMLLTFKVESETLQDDIAEAIKGLFKANGQEIVDLQLLGQEKDELIWSVTAPAFERVLQVA